jgi:CPA2 family monovalent cation:H+ antiporter-2
LAKFDVEIQHVRRPNKRADISPRPDILLEDGDIVVLLGPQEGIVAAEIFLISGQK